MENTVRCFSWQEILLNPNKYANEFSEGNKELETLLLFCFQNGIMTRACCRGHNDYRKPYIYLDLKENQIDMASMIIEELLKSGLGEHLNFSINQQNDENEEKHYLLNCHVDDCKYVDIFFESIKDIIKKYYYANTSSRYKQIFTNLNKIDTPVTSEEKCSFEITIKGIKFCVSKEMYHKEFGLFALTQLPVTDKKVLIDYLESLNSIDDYRVDDLNNSYQFGLDDIDELTKVINKLEESKQY